MKKIIQALTYDDLLIVPQFSDIKSRKEVSLESRLDNNINLFLPIISSPMDTVTETKMAIAMHQAGGLGIIHRYNSVEEQANLVHNAYTEGICNVGGAIGVTGDFEARAAALCDAGANVICVDTAHGHHILMKNALETLRNNFGDKIHIIAGNVATAEGFKALEEWGADSIRIGIGNGSICSTRIKTGFGIPSMTMIFECANIRKKAKIIADGGIKTSGDIVKALAAGADFVMLGSLLAGTDQSPGELYESGQHWLRKKYKIYRGMASRSAQQDWKGSFSSDEGVSARIPYKGDLREVLKELRSGIASGFSYAGARNLTDLKMLAKFIQQTSAGFHESQTHIYNNGQKN